MRANELVESHLLDLFRELSKLERNQATDEAERTETQAVLKDFSEAWSHFTKAAEKRRDLESCAIEYPTIRKAARSARDRFVELERTFKNAQDSVTNAEKQQRFHDYNLRTFLSASPDALESDKEKEFRVSQQSALQQKADDARATLIASRARLEEIRSEALKTKAEFGRLAAREEELRKKLDEEELRKRISNAA